jgi:hypothetical protein
VDDLDQRDPKALPELQVLAPDKDAVNSGVIW